MTTLAGKIKVMQAFSEGKAIEYLSGGIWNLIVMPEWNWATTEYRIKPPTPREYLVILDKFSKIITTVPYSVGSTIPLPPGTIMNELQQVQVREVV